ncbi:MAG: GGDEF and EAL domain-containing protein [Comamonas sp.]
MNADTTLLAAQRRALEQVMAIAEFAPDGRLLRANGNYLALFGYDDAEAACGRYHRSFCPPGYAASAAYDADWLRLCQGQAHSGIVERVRRDGRSCWLEATYTPVRNNRGELLQILKIATDITTRRQQERAREQHLQRLSLVANASDSAILISDDAGLIVYVNTGFSHMFGWREEEVLGRNPLDLLLPGSEAAFKQDYRQTLSAGHPVAREALVHGKDDRRSWVKSVSNPVIDDAGDWYCTVTILTDITQIKVNEVLQQRALEAMAQEKPLAQVLELICEEAERIAPGVVCSILEVDEHGAVHPLAAPSLPPAYRQQIDGLRIGPAAGSCGTAAWRSAPVYVNDIASDPLWVDFRHLVPQGLTSCWSTPFYNSEGRVIGTFAFYVNHDRIAAFEPFHQRLVNTCTHLCALALEREYARRRIRHLAFYDALTGLPNRSLLQAQVDQLLAAAGHGHEQVALLFIDLDRFKQVNDSLGHAAGDELLRQVTHRLRGALQADEIAGRQAGDEFVVALPRCTRARATAVAEQLLALLAKPMTLAGTTLSISGSIGIALSPLDGRDMETLLLHADMAMYQAKSHGKGSFCFFSSEMNVLAQERLQLEAALRQALHDGALHLHYQPQVALASGHLYGVEALARWTHPTLGAISPARFIPLAEECGLIPDLGRWAVREACRQLAEWRAKGLAIPAVSVNLSPTNFHNLDLPGMIAATLQQNTLTPRDLTLELTESVLLDTNPSTMKTMAAIHAQGVRLSMDDFGTGYSSLSYLRRLPVSELKLDRSFVADLDNDPAAQALSRAILGIGKSLQLTVVAEGVETETQNRMLREQGYPVAQGYLFSKPLAAAALEDWLRAHTPLAGAPGAPPAGPAAT